MIGKLSTRRQVLRAAGLTLTAIPLLRLGILPAHAVDGFREMRAKPGKANLRGGGGGTEIWGYGGAVPGPTLRVKRGEEVRVRLVNELPDPTTIHWHGIRIANAMDGVPHLTQKPVLPGDTFEYRFVAPDAGTFWYHPHQYSSEQVERGLSGVLVVDETEPVDVDQDLVLLFDDWRLTATGALDTASFRSFHDAAHAGRIGEHLTVNGQPGLEIPVRKNQRVRLRLVNVANARLMRLRIERHQTRVMAIDGQPAEPFFARDRGVVLGPGNRVDLFVDMTLDAGASAPIVLSGYGDDLPIVRLAYQDGPPVRAEPRSEAKPLSVNPLPERMDFRGALRIDATIEGGAMGGMMMGGGMGMGGMMGRGMGMGGMMGRGMGMMRRGEVPGHGIDPTARVWTLAGQASSGHDGPPLFSVKRGRTVVMSFPNRTAFPHAMHVHGHHFRLLDNLDDGWKPYWLDTVTVHAMETARIAFVADNPGKWMIHCHMLEHQETGMAAWFEVA